MTQEEKELLFKDLCARLPYGVIVHSSGIPHEQKLIGYIPDIEKYCIKPYLHPMSSMNEEERKEFQAFHCVEGLHPYFYQQMCNLPNLDNMFNWLNSHHFDYHGLITMGLALEAHDGMYNIK